MTYRRIAVLPLAAALALGIGGTATAGVSSVHTTTVTVTAKDFSFALSRKTVAAGRVTFVLRNKGRTKHDFAIAGRRSKVVGAGKTTRLTVTLKKGRYPYKCTVDSHAKLGMKGVLRVT
jgi:plastocyanin